jgi:hypothetical protein
MDGSSSPCREVDKAEPKPKLGLYLSEDLAGDVLGNVEEEDDACPLEGGLVDVVRLSLIPICRGFLLLELDVDGSTAGEVGVDARAASREAPALTNNKVDESMNDIRLRFSRLSRVKDLPVIIDVSRSIRCMGCSPRTHKTKYPRRNRGRDCREYEGKGKRTKV